MCLFTYYISFSVSQSKAPLLNQSLTPQGPAERWDSSLPQRLRYCHYYLACLSVWEHNTSNLVLYKYNQISFWNVQRRESPNLWRVQYGALWSGVTTRLPRWYSTAELKMRATHPVTLPFASNWYSLAGVITTQLWLQKSYLSVADSDCLLLFFSRILGKGTRVISDGQSGEISITEDTVSYCICSFHLCFSVKNIIMLMVLFWLVWISVTTCTFFVFLLSE